MSRRSLVPEAAALVLVWLLTSPALANELRRTDEESHSGASSLVSVFSGDNQKNSLTRGFHATQSRVVVRFAMRANDDFAVSSGKKTEILHLMQDGNKKPIVRVISRRSKHGFKLQFLVLDGTRNRKVKKKLAARSEQWTLFQIDWRAASAPGANDGAIRIGRDNVDVVTSVTDLDNHDQGIDEVQIGQVKKIPTGWSGGIFFDSVEIRTTP